MKRYQVGFVVNPAFKYTSRDYNSNAKVESMVFETTKITVKYFCKDAFPCAQEYCKAAFHTTKAYTCYPEVQSCGHSYK